MLREGTTMATKKSVHEVVSFKLRMPEGLRQKIEAEATKAERSMNSEILWRLGQTFGEEWQRFIAGVEAQEKSDEEFLERMRQDPAHKKFMAELIAKHLADKKRQP
jgi:hypothetical protein